MAALRDVKVLLVEDDGDTVKILKKALEKEGCKVEVCFDGNEVDGALEEFFPDVIVLDVMMPEKDGFQVCSELKADERYDDIPIIMLTAVGDHVTSTKYSHDSGKNLEADDYICKGPGQAISLINSIKRLVDI